MSKFCWLYNNLFDSATLTGNSENADFPLENVQSSAYKKSYRTTGVTSEWVKWDFGSDQDIYDFIVKYHNIQVGATVYIQANATDSWGAPSLSQAITVTADQFAVHFTSVKSYRWWRLTVVDTTNPDGYIRIGRIYCGGYYEVSINYNSEFDYEPQDDSELIESDGGSVYSVVGPDQYGKWGLKFENLNDTDYLTLNSIFAIYGKHIPMFICFDREVASDVSKYIFVKNWKWGHTPWDSFYSLDLDFEEAKG